MHIDKYERAFIRLGIFVLIAFAAAVALSVLGLGVTLPGVVDIIDPQNIEEDPGFASPGVREVYPGKYVAYLQVQSFIFTPAVITVPQGAEVTFFLTSRDVIHGFKVFDTNINIMVIPGQISEVTHTFDEPGEYQFYCHEYCGSGHATMSGQVIVTPADEVAAGNQ